MQNHKIKAAVIGATGYTGAELIRILAYHNEVELTQLISRSKAGQSVAEVMPELSNGIDLNFSGTISAGADVWFLALPHGASKSFLQEHKALADQVKIIDLSNEFRPINQSKWEDYHFTFGLPELRSQEIQKANHIANPGCFATAIQLGVLPLISANSNSKEIHTHAITGSTGAGLKLTETSHFSWRNNNVSWYKPFTHQHLNEVYKTIEKKYNINFIPIRGNFSRGIFCTSYIKTELDIDSIYKIYFDFYNDHPFTVVSNEEIHLKQVINTNKCLIHLKKIEGKLLITSIIDNLIKGASGQAIQNMNLMFGFDETTGLKLKSSIF